MAPAHPGDVFPATRCTTCEREVLCYFDLDDGDCERLRCLHCTMPAEAAAIRWLDRRGLEALGYDAVSAEEKCGGRACGAGRCCAS